MFSLRSMHVPERFQITIRGTKARVRERDIVKEGVGYLLGQLVHYDGDFPLDAFRPWGLVIDVEECTDQGPE